MLCILANIADGKTAKELIMTNDDMLQKIKYYMVQYLIPSAVAHSYSLFIRSHACHCCSSMLCQMKTPLTETM